MILLAYAVERELAFLPPHPGIERLATGVGPVEAACAVARALSQQRYKLVINAGIGGAFGDAAQIGDGVVVESDTMLLRTEGGEPLSLPDGQTLVETAHSDEKLCDLLSSRGFARLRGLTVGTVTSTAATAQRLSALRVQVESMEGFAVLRAAAVAGVSAIELRGISNRVGPRESSGWNFAAGTAGLERATNALLDLLTVAGLHV